MHQVVAVDPGGLLGQELKSFLATHGFQLISARDPSEAARAVEGGKAQAALLCLPPEEDVETLFKDLEGLRLPLLAVSSRLDPFEGAARSELRLIVPPRPYPLLLALEELTKGLALKREQERLLEEIGHQRFALAVFNEVGKALTSTLKLHEVLNIIAEKISSQRPLRPSQGEPGLKRSGPPLQNEHQGGGPGGPVRGRRVRHPPPGYRRLEGLQGGRAPPAESGLNLRITASFGVASFPAHALNKGDLIRLADQAMYRAKGAQRNCVFLAADLLERDR